MAGLGFEARQSSSRVYPPNPSAMLLPGQGGLVCFTPGRGHLFLTLLSFFPLHCSLHSLFFPQILTGPPFCPACFPQPLMSDWPGEETGQVEPWALPSQISPSLLLGLDEEVSLPHTSPHPLHRRSWGLCGSSHLKAESQEIGHGFSWI